MKLLIIDDNKSIHSLFSCIFKDSQYKISNAKNGEEALEMIRWEDFKIIFLDLVMPKMYGLEFIKKIRELKPGKCPKIVLMTGADADELIKEAFELGAIGCLYKPFEEKEVLDMLSKHT